MHAPRIVQTGSIDDDTLRIVRKASDIKVPSLWALFTYQLFMTLFPFAVLTGIAIGMSVLQAGPVLQRA